VRCVCNSAKPILCFIPSIILTARSNLLNNLIHWVKIEPLGIFHFAGFQ